MNFARKVSTSRGRLMAVVLLAGLVLLGAGDDSARVEKLGHQMVCMCGCNQILLECNHVGCTYSSRMRNELVAAIDSGKSDSGVLEWFVGSYGATVLAAPTKQGFDRLAWVMPYLILAGGVGVVVAVVYTWRRRLSGAPASAPPVVETRSSDLDRFREQARKETAL